MKAATKDQVEVAAVFYNNLHNRNIERATFWIREPWAKWHTENNCTLRDLSEVVPWELRQLKGDFRNAMVASFRKLNLGRGLIQHFGFTTDFLVREAVLDDHHPLLKLECDFAALVASYACNLNTAGYKRMCKLLRGWPRRLVGALDAGMVDSTLALFKKDFKNWENLQTSQAGFQARR